MASNANHRGHIAAPRGPDAVKPRTTTQREAYWRHHAEAHVASGLTVRAYCHKHALAESAFYYWRARLAKQNPACATHSGSSTPSGITARAPASITPAAKHGHPIRFAEITLAPRPDVVADASSVPNTHGAPAIPPATRMSADGIEAVLPGGIRLVIGPAVPVEYVASLLRALAC